MLHPLPHPCTLPPQHFTFPFAYTPHPLVEQAATEVMRYLRERAQESAEWAEGKMFGVLIVEDAQGEVGFLAGYSGLLLGRNDLPYFVPAVYDFLHPGSYFKERDAEISAVNRAVEALEQDEDFRAVISGPSIGDLTPSLDDMTVFPKTETKYIVAEIEKEVERRRWECYVIGEIYSKKSADFVSLGFLATTPSGFLFGPKIGYSLGEPFIGGTLGYRITHRR